MLVGDVAMIGEGIICKTCAEMDIEIIEIAVNPDHFHIFFKYPPKYPLSYTAKKIKEVQAGSSEKNSPISENGVANISGLQAVSMGQSGVDGML